MKLFILLTLFASCTSVNHHHHYHLHSKGAAEALLSHKKEKSGKVLEKPASKEVLERRSSLDKHYE